MKAVSRPLSLKCCWIVLSTSRKIPYKAFSILPALHWKHYTGSVILPTIFHQQKNACWVICTRGVLHKSCRPLSPGNGKQPPAAQKVNENYYTHSSNWAGVLLQSLCFLYTVWCFFTELCWRMAWSWTRIWCTFYQRMDLGTPVWQ